MPEYLSVQEARERIQATLTPVGLEEVALQHSAGRILAVDLIAPADLPAFANSSMDGYALIAEDTASASVGTPVILSVVGDIPAGSSHPIRISNGQAARIMTGAMLPTGANAVVPVEDTGKEKLDPDLPDQIRLEKALFPGTCVRQVGEDVHKGQCLLSKGRCLQPQDIGTLAATGHAQVTVYRKPRIALFSTGSELVPPGMPLGPGQIYDSNQYVLAAMLDRAGAEVLRLQTVSDDAQAITQTLMQAVTAQVDLIVTSAGVSVGAYDYMREVIENQGSLDFWRVNIRPGKPLAFGAFSGIPLIGLPGNPVSAYVGCRAFVVPAVTRLGGRQPSQALVTKARLGEEIRSDGRESYLRAVVKPEGGNLVARLTGHQGSGNLYSLVQANALLIVPSGVKSLPSDSEVTIWYLDAE